MKKLILVCLMIGLVLALGTPAMALNSPGKGINATSHDLSGLGAASQFGDGADQAGLNRICIYCHAPHNTIRPDAPGGTWTYMPLWNHGKTTNVGSFTMYSNGSDDPGSISHKSQAMLLAFQPGSVSLLCLSCHDGSISTNMYGSPGSSSVGGNDKTINSGTKRGLIGLGGDLSNHHPIGFDYLQVQTPVDDEIRLSTDAGFLTDPIDGSQPNGPKTIAELLWGNNVECVSCHDVHNTKNGGDKLTWVQDRQSKLCLTCHNKDQVDRP